jgi:hypothetical protein
MAVVAEHREQPHPSFLYDGRVFPLFISSRLLLVVKKVRERALSLNVRQRGRSLKG